MANVTFEHVTKQFDGAAAVNDFSLDVPESEFMVLVGPLRLREEHGPADARRPGAPDRRSNPHR